MNHPQFLIYGLKISTPHSLAHVFCYPAPQVNLAKHTCWGLTLLSKDTVHHLCLVIRSHLPLWLIISSQNTETSITELLSKAFRWALQRGAQQPFLMIIIRLHFASANATSSSFSRDTLLLVTHCKVPSPSLPSLLTGGPCPLSTSPHEPIGSFWHSGVAHSMRTPSHTVPYTLILLSLTDSMSLCSSVLQ